MGYAQPLIRLDFPDLAEDGDPIWVVIRSPKTMPNEAFLLPSGAAALDENSPEAMTVTYEMIARFVHDWHVYDATATGPEADVPLPVPATPELLAKLPVTILRAISDEMKKVTATPQ
jgi:hypothetical protein